MNNLKRKRSVSQSPVESTLAERSPSSIAAFTVITENSAAKAETVRKHNHTCYVCHKTFSKASRLNRHLRTHSGERPFACEACGVSYTRREHLKRHLLAHKIERPFKCQKNDCNYATTEKSRLSRHWRQRHEQSDTFPFICDVPDCTYGCKKKSQLKKHSFVHTGVAPFACTVETCDKRFMIKKSLTAHQKLHEGRLYICGEDDCHEVFTTLHERRQHIARAHPSDCIVCGKSFRKRHSLRAHMAVHRHSHPSLVEKHISIVEAQNFYVPRFICPIETCGKAFTRSSNLRTHIRSVHEDARFFECPFMDICGKSFAHKHVLQRHVKHIHENQHNDISHHSPTGDFKDIIFGASRPEKEAMLHISPDQPPSPATDSVL